MVVEEVWEQGQGGVCAEEGPGWEGKKAESQTPGLVACSRVDPGRTSNYRPSPASDPLGLALGSPIFPSGCKGKLGVALESLQGRRDLT